MKKSIHHSAYLHFALRLKSARIESGLRQTDVGTKLGVARSWISKVEQAELRLDVLQVLRLCRVYGIEAWPLVRKMEEELSDEDDSSSYLSDGRPVTFTLQVLRHIYGTFRRHFGAGGEIGGFGVLHNALCLG